MVLGLTIHSLDILSGTTVLYEEFKFASFSAYSAETLTDVKVYANNYEAGAVDIEYNWIFVLKNPLNEDDKILLKFPPNDYILK